MPAEILTERLELIPMSPAFLCASLGGDRIEAGKHIGLQVPEPQSVDQHVLSLRLEQLKANPELQPWLLRAIGLRETREMIGHIGFHSSPGADYLQPWSPGGVEFGFTVFPAHRRKGYAREAAQALMQWAKNAHRVTDFVVTVSPQNKASQALVAQLGFARVGGHVDDMDGPEDILTLHLSHVERLSAADVPRYRDFMLHAYATTHDVFTSTVEEREAETAAWWLRRVADPDGRSVALGAFRNGQLVGTVTVEFAAKSRTRHKAKLIGMFVHEEFRGLGVGKSLVKAALAEAGSRPEVRVVTLTVTEGNTPARNLYERFGFRQFGVEPMALSIPDGYKSKVHMWWVPGDHDEP